MSKSPTSLIRHSQGATLASLLSRLYSLIQAKLQRLTAVNELENLTERQLRDVGIERYQIEQIAAREIDRLHAK